MTMKLLRHPACLLAIFIVWTIEPAFGRWYEWNETSRQHIVDIHNDYRRNEGACQMNKLVYDMQLERRAKFWTETCELIPPSLGSHFNVYTATLRRENDLITLATEDWFASKNEYTQGQCGISCPYAQMLWDTAQKVGCYSKSCLRLNGARAENFWYFLCFYTPKVNTTVQKPYKTSCATPCRNGQTEEDGLCVGGGNADCVDRKKRCALWSSQGHCELNADYLNTVCMKSCGACESKHYATNDRFREVGITDDDYGDDTDEGSGDDTDDSWRGVTDDGSEEVGVTDDSSRGDTDNRSGGATDDGSGNVGVIDDSSRVDTDNGSGEVGNTDDGSGDNTDDSSGNIGDADDGSGNIGDADDGSGNISDTEDGSGDDTDYGCRDIGDTEDGSGDDTDYGCRDIGDTEDGSGDDTDYGRRDIGDGSGDVGVIDDGSKGENDDGSGGVGVTDDGSGDVGVTDDDSGDVGVPDDGSGDVGVTDDGSGDVGVPDDGSGNVTVLDVSLMTVLGVSLMMVLGMLL